MSTRNSTPVQLSPDELQQLKWLLGGLLTLVSVATVFYLDIAAWALMAITAAAVIAVMVRPSLPGKIPRWGHRLAFPLIVAFFSADLWLTGELLPSLVRLDILLLLYRGITYRQKRDDLQVIVLGLFLVVLAGVLTVSLTFAVHILGFAAGAMALLLVITLAEASAGMAYSAPPLGTTPDWARTVEWGRLLRRVRQVTDWRVVALGSALFAGLVALSALLFIAIPRFQFENGLFLERFITKKARTGFSDTIKFGDVTEIQQDNRVALIVDVTDRNQMPASPYWRMLVLDEYRDGTFKLSTGFRRNAFSGEQHGQNVRGGLRGKVDETTVWTFFLESGVSRYLPLLGPFTQLRFREPQSYRTVRGLPVVALRDDPVTMIAYRVEGMEYESQISDADFGARFATRGSNPLAAGAFMLSLTMTENDLTALERIRGQIMADDPVTAREFGERATAWLRNRHGYSLTPSLPAGAGDPLVRWMDGTGGGHCELFAGSLVVLARSAGLPARVVVGFRGGTWNGFSNSFSLRNSDSHAWCEIFDSNAQSWLRVDPTPGAAATEAAGAASEVTLARRNDRSWKARLESLRVFWYRQIVNFDQRSQMETLNAVKQVTENSSRQVRATFDRWGEGLREWITTPWSVRRAAGFISLLMGLMVVGVVAFRVYRFFKFRRWGSQRSGAADLIRAEAGKWLRRLTSHRGDNRSSAERDDVLRELQRVRFGLRDTWPEVGPLLRRAKTVWRNDRRDRRQRTS